MEFTFTAVPRKTAVFIEKEIPCIRQALAAVDPSDGRGAALVICDTNTETMARQMLNNGGGVGWTTPPLCVIPAGEAAKNWTAVETILLAAKKAGIDRTGVFIAVGGGVLTDVAGFAAASYMRGACLVLIPTTLLCMADAAVGGKTGIDLAEIKNFAGAFYPANAVFMAHDTLKTLPERELASGFAEIIKTAVLYGGETELLGTPFSALRNYDIFAPLISRVVAYKGAITGEDPEERGGKRFLLNLGHTFGHALESAAGLGALTHGEAVAWGMVRAVELGCRLGITPSARAGEITAIIEQNGFITTPRHPALKNEAVFWNAMLHDKKKMKGQLRFVIPNDHSAEVTTIPENEVRTVLQ